MQTQNQSYSIQNLYVNINFLVKLIVFNRKQHQKQLNFEWKTHTKNTKQKEINKLE